MLWILATSTIPGTSSLQIRSERVWTALRPSPLGPGTKTVYLTITTPGPESWYWPRLKPKLSAWALKEDGIAHPTTGLRRYASSDSTAGTSPMRPRDGWVCALKTLTGGKRAAAFCTCARPPCLSQHAAANVTSNFSELQLRKRKEDKKLERWRAEGWGSSVLF